MVRSSGSSPIATASRRNLPGMSVEDPAAAPPLVRTAGRHVTRIIAGETLIVPIAGGVADLEAIYTLNPVGSRVWQLLERPVAFSHLIAVIVEEFDVSPTEAAHDITEFIESLRAAGLIEAAECRG